MATITIPKEIVKEKDLVIIPRKEYERFLRFEKTAKKAKSATDLAIEEGLRDLREGRVSPTFSSAKEAIRYLHRRAKKYNKPSTK
ncbi:MAG: hypothetical protein G01um101430_676 [Parcubacteria group bacterium Gr01-1014_30]|nr:MAG: hypothetical protein G01um101430_676 [Parcubacteria group bacterium Gr01-1014_30]